MAVRDKEIQITPSILDRLIDMEPRIPTEPSRSRLSRLTELKQSVRRDLEWILNTRCVVGEIDDRMEEVKSSLAVYGLPDFTGLGAKDLSEQERIQGAIEDAVRLFEPRFIGVKVTLDPVTNTDKHLTFRIEASLDVEPAPEPVVFDTVLQVGTSGFTVVEK